MNKRIKSIFIICTMLWGTLPIFAEPITVGSKAFSENRLLGEIIQQHLEKNSIKSQHKKGMGSTLIVWQALVQGSIDLYVEYSGTVAEHILKEESQIPISQLQKRLAKEHSILASNPIGFNNSYGLVMKREKASALNIKTIQDLAGYPTIRYGLTHEFLARLDGWPRLREFYKLPGQKLKGIDHNLGYDLLSQNEIDVKDTYTTDGRLKISDFIVLEDNLNFFPNYQAIVLYRKDLSPKVVQALKELEGSIDQETMIDLNLKTAMTKNENQIAAQFTNSSNNNKGPDLYQEVFSYCTRHLYLVFIAIFFVLLIGLPLGVVAASETRLSRMIIGGVDILQTIPSLALLALLVPIFGISTTTAIMALFLYGLLPVVRNTAVGLHSIPPSIVDSAQSLGISTISQYRLIFLPYAFPTILTGIKTSFIMNIGTATLAALIGAGGLGEPILTGLSLNDYRIVLKGAIPAALIAILAQCLFFTLDKFLISPGMRR